MQVWFTNVPHTRLVDDKEGRIGLPRTKINSDSLEEELTSFIEHINS
jgi:hypothetical protein